MPTGCWATVAAEAPETPKRAKAQQILARWSGPPTPSHPGRRRWRRDSGCPRRSVILGLPVLVSAATRQPASDVPGGPSANCQTGRVGQWRHPGLCRTGQCGPRYVRAERRARPGRHGNDALDGSAAAKITVPDNLQGQKDQAFWRSRLLQGSTDTDTHRQAPGAVYGLRTADGGALLFYAVTAQLTLAPPDGQSFQIGIPGYYSPASTQTSAVVGYIDQFATYDPPRSGSPRIIADTSGSPRVASSRPASPGSRRHFRLAGETRRTGQGHRSPGNPRPTDQ